MRGIARILPSMFWSWFEGTVTMVSHKRVLDNLCVGKPGPSKAMCPLHRSTLVVPSYNRRERTTIWKD